MVPHTETLAAGPLLSPTANLAAGPKVPLLPSTTNMAAGPKGPLLIAKTNLIAALCFKLGLHGLIFLVKFYFSVIIFSYALKMFDSWGGP